MHGYIYMYIQKCVCVSVSMCFCVYVCLCVCIYVCIYISIYVYTYKDIFLLIFRFLVYCFVGFSFCLRIFLVSFISHPVSQIYLPHGNDITQPGPLVLQQLYWERAKIMYRFSFIKIHSKQLSSVNHLANQQRYCLYFADRSCACICMHVYLGKNPIKYVLQQF